MNLKLKTWNLKHLVNAFEKKLQLVMKSLSSEQFPVANQQRRNRNRKKQSIDVRTFLP